MIHINKNKSKNLAADVDEGYLKPTDSKTDLMLLTNTQQVCASLSHVRDHQQLTNQSSTFVQANHDIVDETAIIEANCDDIETVRYNIDGHQTIRFDSVDLEAIVCNDDIKIIANDDGDIQTIKGEDLRLIRDNYDDLDANRCDSDDLHVARNDNDYFQRTDSANDNYNSLQLIYSVDDHQNNYLALGGISQVLTTVNNICFYEEVIFCGPESSVKYFFKQIFSQLFN